MIRPVARPGHRRAPRRELGLTLVELMIAMALGLVVVGGAVTVFSGTLRSAELGQSVAAMQAGGRFALDLMSSDLRAAGHRGCAASDETELFVDATLAGAADLLRGGSVGGARVVSAGWSPAAPAGFVAATGAGAPVDGTDALFVQYAAAPGVALGASMTGPGDDLELAEPIAGLAADTLAVVSDCLSADVFEIDSVGGTAAAPTLDPKEDLERAYARNPAFPESARVLPFVGAIYYVGDTGRTTSAGDPVRALYLQQWPYDAGAVAPIELVEGVDQMQLRFGLGDGTGGVRQVRPDDAAMDAAAVESVQIELLMASDARLLDADPTRAFELAGRQVGPLTGATAAGTPAYPNDRRMRVGYGTLVRLRNTNPEGISP